jgi:hypothetical protein
MPRITPAKSTVGIHIRIWGGINHGAGIIINRSGLLHINRRRRHSLHNRLGVISLPDRLNGSLLNHWRSGVICRDGIRPIGRISRISVNGRVGVGHSDPNGRANGESSHNTGGNRPSPTPRPRIRRSKSGHRQGESRNNRSFHKCFHIKPLCIIFSSPLLIRRPLPSLLFNRQTASLASLALPLVPAIFLYEARG